MKIQGRENNLALKWNVIDLIIVLSFALFASFYQLNRAIGNSLFLFLSSDMDNSASFAACLDQPELFEGDEVLADKRNFDFYATIHVPIARIFSRFTGDYASPLILLVGLHVFLQVFGFYLFGRQLFESRYWAVLLAILTMVYVPLGMGEFWGIFYDSLARFSFQAVLPFLLAAVLYWRNKPVIWPGLLFAAGLMMYLHPVSAPCWGFAVWLSLWLFLPKAWNITKRSCFMFFTGIFFILGALPFTLSYMGTHIKVPPQDYNLIMEIIRYRYARGLFDIPYGITSFFKNIAFTRIVIAGIIGLIYVFVYHRQERRKVAVFLLWIAAILFISVVMPFSEQIIAARNSSVPELFNFPRCFRYVFPLMLVFCLWPFVAISKNSNSEKSRKLAVIIGLIFVSVWGGRQMYKEIKFLYNKNCFIFNPDKTKASQTIDMLNAIKRLTPPKSRLMVMSSMRDLAVRYYAQRPLVYSGKDGGVLNYTSRDGLIKWYRKTKAIDKVTEEIIGLEDNLKIRLLLDLSRQLDAQYLVVDRSEFSEDYFISKNAPVYYNNLFILLNVGTFTDSVKGK